MAETLEMFGRALNQLSMLVGRVRNEQLELPTPCQDWDVRALLTHLVTGNRRVAAGIGPGGPPAEAAAELADPLVDFPESVRAVKAAWKDPERMTQMVGNSPAPDALRLRIVESVVHGWDLARATGQTPGFDDDLIDDATEFVRTRMPADRPANPAFQPPAGAPVGAAKIDQLAAFLGRNF